MARLQSNRGSALIELIIVILVMSVMSTMMLVPSKSDLLSVQDFQSLVIHTHFNAMLHHQTITVDGPIVTDYAIRFNALGHVNMGQTIRIGHRDLVVLITSGRIREKSVSDD